MECAVWYWSHGSIYYTLCRDEQEAAQIALDFSDGDSRAPAGVQRSDGSYTPVDEWDEYEVENQRRWQQAYERVRAEASRPKPATRKIRVPWDDDDREVTVEGDAPVWLGRQVASR